MEPGVKAAVAKKEKIQSDTKDKEEVCKLFSMTKDRVLAMAFLMGADMNRHKEMIQSFENAFTVGRDE